MRDDVEILAETSEEARRDALESDAAEDRSPDLAERLYATLLRTADLDGPSLGAEILALEKEYGEAVFAELVFLLSHLRFRATEARAHWEAILKHGDDIRKRLEMPVDVRVAMVSYFMHVNKKLEHPKIVELRVFQRAQTFAYRDELTGLHNYRFFLEFLEQEVLRATRSHAPLSLVMVDLDGFKQVNDRLGHETGNDVLAAVARLLDGTIRREDISARYGGEEFALILPATPKPAAQRVAERARLAVARHEFPSGRLTVSMGVATFPGDAAGSAQLVRCADRALYDAKSAGKNQVHLYGRNMRSHRRVAIDLAGTIRFLAQESSPFRTVNVSEGGLLVVTDRMPPDRSLAEIHISLPGGESAFAAAARLVYSVPRDDGRFEAALRFVEMPAADRFRLSRLVATVRHDADEGDPDIARS